MLLSIKEAHQYQCENIERIAELQLNKKELRDLNRKMKHYSDEMEKLTILRERNRMSKQIHDSIGHVLTAVSVQLEAAEILIKKNPDESIEKIQNAKKQTQGGLSSIKEALSLIDEDYIQFKDKLFYIIKNSEKNMSVKILPRIDIDGCLSTTVQELLLSALKEGITNGVRHGQATAFVCRLLLENGNIVFYLDDNGTGANKINMGYGLTAMEKQILELGGTLDVHSVKNEGFSLKIVIPKEGNP
jgi:signal transduction histidine kinase